MATEQPNVAPDDIKPEPNDADTAATVLDDAQMDRTPGGGGLGGADAADPLSGAGRTSGGQTPNSPIDVPVPHGDGDPTREAQLRSLNDGPPEPRGNSG
jgi:hypothetical protein